MLNLFTLTINAMESLFEWLPFTEILVAILILSFVANLVLFVKET